MPRHETAPTATSPYRASDPAATGTAQPQATRARALFKDLRRTVAAFREDNLTDWAAALTYYGLLSLFPALIAIVSIVGLFGDPEETTEKLTEIVTRLGPESGAETFSGPIESITSNRGAAGVLLVVGLAVALWSASGYVGAFMRASNAIHEADETRPFWKLRPLQLLITLLMVVLVAALAIALVMTGPLVEAVAGTIGIDDTALTIWNIAKWPVMLAMATIVIAILYQAAPPHGNRRFVWLTPGVITALVVWLLASAAFALYVANFGSYDKTYGTLGGIVVMLVWLWVTNVALLFGRELDAVLGKREGERRPEGA
jgi:membrane protein